MLGSSPPLCRFHVGRKAEVVHAEYFARRQADAIFAQHGVAKLESPLLALRDLGAEVIAWKEACRAMLGSLDELRYGGHGGAGEQLRAEVVLYERALERAAKILVDLTRLGVEERLSKMNVDQGKLVAEAIKWVLASLGLVDNLEVNALVIRALRAMTQEGVTLPAPHPLSFRVVEIESAVEPPPARKPANVRPLRGDGDA